MRWDDPAPHEREAGERSWEVVRAAWEERIPPARPSLVRRRWPVLAVAAGLAVVAAALSSPGMAVLGGDDEQPSARGQREEGRRGVLDSDRLAHPLEHGPARRRQDRCGRGQRAGK